MRLSPTLLLICVLLIWVRSAEAELVERDLFSDGDGLITLDTASGLEWLDLTETAGQTYDSVLAGFGGFTTTLGFRFATQAEVVAFYLEGGLIDVSGSWGTENFAGAGLLLDRLGCTGNCGGTSPFLQGLADYDTFDPLIADSPFVQQSLSSGLARASVEIGREKASFENAAVGSYLVRAVAEGSEAPAAASIPSLGAWVTPCLLAMLVALLRLNSNQRLPALSVRRRSRRASI